jgi:MFS family permease
MAGSPSGAQRLPLSRMFKGASGNVFILLCLMYFIEYVDRVNLSAAAPDIKAEFHLSNTKLGLALSAFGYCYAAFQIIGGFAGDRLGPRITLTFCGVLWATGTLLTSLAGGLGGLVLARLLVGLGEAGTFPTSARVIANWVPTVRRGFAQGFTHSAARLAAAVTPPIVVMLLPFIGWRGAFLVLGIVSLTWVAAWALYFRDDPRQHPGVVAAELAELPSYLPHRESIAGIPWLPLLKRILPVTLVFFCHAWTLWLYLSWLPSFFADTYHLDHNSMALISSAVFFAGMIGDTVGGLVTDAIYHRTGDVVKSRRNTVIVGFGGSLLCLVPVLFVHGQTGAAVALGAALFFLEMSEAPIWAVPIDVARRYASFASGIMTTAAGLAAVISPAAFGVISDLTGSYRLPFLASIALLAAGIALSFAMRPDRMVIETSTSSPTAGTMPSRLEVPS